MDCKDLVSVIMPVYNVENYIQDSLESIVKQTYSSIEIILVDDGSTDSSIDVAKNYLEGKDIKWQILSQENKGQAAARNYGISKASGEWIICPDSDDYLVSGAIERLLLAAKKYNSECASCNIKRVNLEHLKDGVCCSDNEEYLPINKLKKVVFARTIEIVAPGTLIKKELFNRIEYDEHCPHSEDTHFLWKLIYEINSMVYITGDYYNYLQRRGSTIHTLSKDNYLKTSKKFDELSEMLSKRFPNDFYANRIAARQRLGALHMLAKCNDYQTFKSTIVEDGYRRDMSKLLLCGNFKVFVISVVFCMSTRLFYLAAKTYFI
ncbi:MAG: putative glycosyltransferase EpsJ [Firmicutes bacterium ADurb.Bin419]|nr:MAG: putative glycosyltransferase EpsJ [Firmicutes bacterium ADurb.Bin419]